MTNIDASSWWFRRVTPPRPWPGMGWRMADGGWRMTEEGDARRVGQWVDNADERPGRRSMRHRPPIDHLRTGSDHCHRRWTHPPAGDGSPQCRHGIARIRLVLRLPLICFIFFFLLETDLFFLFRYLFFRLPLLLTLLYFFHVSDECSFSPAWILAAYFLFFQIIWTKIWWHSALLLSSNLAIVHTLRTIFKRFLFPMVWNGICSILFQLDPRVCSISGTFLPSSSS